MDQETRSQQAIKEQGVLPLFYHAEPAACLRIVQALYAGGMRVVEFTNRGPAALANFRALAAAVPGQFPGLLLGAGTITTAEEAEAFIEAGADFLVSPVFDAGVCDKAYLHKRLWLPGCMTPTEVHQARQAGCRMVKLFPGQVLGPAFIEAIRPLFADMDYVVTGGVAPTADSMGAWWRAGACAMGLGSQLIISQAADNPAALTAACRQVLGIIQSLKNA